VLTTLLLALSLTAAPPPINRTSPYCPAIVYPDYVLGVTYYAVVLRDASCLTGQVARVRKASTLNIGARYRPIQPLRGAWEITESGNTLPGNRWTLYTWRWEYWDGASWLPAART
jgi:hypothetical protein